MAKAITFTLEGGEDIKKALKKAARRFPKETGSALFEEAEKISGVAVNRTPVEFGALAGSATVATVEKDGKGVFVDLGFGLGPPGEYAVVVHERTDVAHKRGQSKFLESAVNDGAKGMLSRLASRIKRKVG